MARKIVYAIISLVILYFGYSAFTRLNYWDRCTGIFKLDGSQPVNRRMGREGPESERGVRTDFRNIPDSIRQIFADARPEFRTERREFRQIPDSARRGNAGPGFRGSDGRAEGRGHGDFRGGKKINLNNIWWFMAVFSSFTVIVLYLDRLIILIRKRRFA
jgi:hypothetical protein